MRCKVNIFYGFCNMLHDDQKETVWQRKEFHLNIKMFHRFKLGSWRINTLRIMNDHWYVNWVNSFNFNYILYIGLFIKGMAAVSISSDILGFSNILTLTFNSRSFLAGYLEIDFNSRLQKFWNTMSGRLSYLHDFFPLIMPYFKDTFLQ
jgi:hypothetical protein